VRTDGAMSNRPLRKKFKYRDNTGSPQSVHAEHWKGFRWRSGNVIVRAYGPWGQLQIWAASEAEARRVFLHACSVAGWNLDEQLTDWAVGSAGGERNGRSGLMATKETPLGVEVTKRSGPSGFPVIG
jgi:hypothetical protein